MSELVEKRKRGQHKEGCDCLFCQRRKGAVAVIPIEAGEPEPQRARASAEYHKKKAEVTGDAFDRKLDHFQYTLDPKEAAIWEHDESVSPLHVPPELKKKYPNMTFRWVSDYKLRTKGAGYNGWQLFRDGKHAEGVKRGHDLHLAAMPKEMAESYRRAVSERSSRMVRNAQEAAVANLEQRTHGIRDIEMLAPGDEVVDKATGQKRPIGLSIGARPAVGRGGAFQRGMSQAEVRDRVQQVIEKNRSRKSYVFMGGK